MLFNLRFSFLWSFALLLVPTFGEDDCPAEMFAPIVKPCIATCNQYLASPNYPSLNCMDFTKDWNHEKECFCKKKLGQTWLINHSEKCIPAYKCPSKRRHPGG